MDENFCQSIADAISSKKVVIYGAGNLGAAMLNIMEKIGKEVIFFLDQNPDKQKSGFCGYEVKAPEEILYEDMLTTMVVVAVGAKTEIEDLLTGYGLRKGIEFIYGATMRYEACDAIDPLLGYCRSSDMNGFKVMGGGVADKEYKNIICLGGSTTDYSEHNIKSWPEYLFELFRDDSININVLNGGVIGYNSSQELLKLIRDGLEMTPSLVISYSGVNDMGYLDSTSLMGNKYLHDLWENVISGNNSRSIVFSDELSIAHNTKTSLDSAEYWYRNEKIMYSICNGFSIPFIGILQPAAYTKNAKFLSINEQRTFTEISNREYIMKQFEKAKQLVSMDEEGAFLDFTTLFDEYEDVYIDNCHVFEKGNKIIAESIYKVIKERHILDT